MLFQAGVRFLNYLFIIITTMATMRIRIAPCSMAASEADELYFICGSFSDVLAKVFPDPMMFHQSCVAKQFLKYSIVSVAF